MSVEQPPARAVSQTWACVEENSAGLGTVGHYALHGPTEYFVFVYDLKKETVSDYFLINIDCELESTASETLDCMHRWAEADQLRFSLQIIRLRAHVRARYSVITQSADNSDVLNEPEEEQLG